MENMSEEIIEGGLSTTSKCVKWKLKNFAQMFAHKSLVKRQIILFDVTDFIGVTSKWRAQLDFKTLLVKETEEATGIEQCEPQTCLQLSVILHSIPSTSSDSVRAKVTVTVEGKGESRIFRGVDDCLFTEGENVSWSIKPLQHNMNISHLLMADGTMIIKIDMLIFDGGLDLISEKYYESDMEWKRKFDLHRDISSLQNDEANSDVKIVSKDGREFFAYRWILRGASDVFEAMFRVNMREKEMGLVKFEDLSGDAVKVLLHYIYTGKMAEEWKTPGVVEEVVYAADKFQFRNMKFYLNLRLEKVCTIENAAALLTLANQTGLNIARDGILKFVQKNIRDYESFLVMFNNVCGAAGTDASNGSLQNSCGGRVADLLQVSSTDQNQNGGGACDGGAQNDESAVIVIDSPTASPSPSPKRIKYN